MSGVPRADFYQKKIPYRAPKLHRGKTAAALGCSQTDQKYIIYRVGNSSAIIVMILTAKRKNSGA